ncbi:protein ROOT INITIATION DEFECTIVE 3-like [Rutidosis leptorrhynchoides]|uniref:protein ROOT INITIATION DEFECTIVE 3-like n=1 Tax=Rutidosis leptorrhynchoides TaxID=125765 RepID=UPI003A9A5BFF
MGELLIASSSVDSGIGCWDLHTGADLLRYKSCASPPHGLVCVGHRFLASSQIRDSGAASISYWSWSKPQVDVKSFPSETIKPLAANSEGTYIAGGGSSGNIYFWEVATGRLLKKWNAHLRAVTCLVFSDDSSLIVSASEEGNIKLWSLFMIFDDYAREQASHIYEHSFAGYHSGRVTDLAIGLGGGNAIVVSACEDKTCKVWSLAEGRLLRDVIFPSEIDAIVLDPGEQVFYAGGRDHMIYIAALNAESKPNKNYQRHIIGVLSGHSKGITCLASSSEGNLLLSGSADGEIRVWEPKTHTNVRTFQHSTGPVNNILVVSRSLSNVHMQTSSRRHGSSSFPPLSKFSNSVDENTNNGAIVTLHSTCEVPINSQYRSAEILEDCIKELQQQGSAASTEMEVERLKQECNRHMQMNQQWKKMYDNLHQFCVNELVDGDQKNTSSS